jgi:hypothetical protein
VIANCPSCGTHYKHELPKERLRARCGRCDATVDLTRLRPYRIVPAAQPTAEQSKRAARHLPIGLDHPGLATAIAHNVERSRATDATPSAAAAPAVRISETWDEDDPLPQIPEMSVAGIHEGAGASAADDAILRLVPAEAIGEVAPDDPGADAPLAAGGGAVTFILWLATGAIAGTGVSWTMGGTTMTGMVAGAAIGAVAGWGWLRWTSPK